MISSTAAKVVAGVAIALTLILAFVGYRVSRQYAVETEQAKAQVAAQAKREQEKPKILAVVAAKPLAAYKKIGKDDVVLTEVSVAPLDYYTSLEEVVDREPLVDVDQGAPVTKRYFAEGNVLAKSVPSGFKAISVEVSDVVAVGGFVRPGDIVDVLLYLRGAGSGEVSDSQARILLKDTRVLAYQELLVDRPQGLKEEEGRERGGRRQRTAVLAVPDAQTTRLMLGASMGELRLALHGAQPAEGEPGADTAVAALPMSDEALQAEAAKLAPDLTFTAKQLSRVELSADQKKQGGQQKVYVYRGSQIQAVTP